MEMFFLPFWLNMRQIEFIHEDPHTHKSTAKLISSRFYTTESNDWNLNLLVLDLLSGCFSYKRAKYFRNRIVEI